MRYSVEEKRYLRTLASHCPVNKWRSTRSTTLSKNIVLTVQDYSLFAYRALMNLFRPPVYWTDFLIQSDIIGVGSLSIVVLSGFSTGGVLALAVGGHALRVRRNRGHRPICQP